jgi:hypothetical protein
MVEGKTYISALRTAFEELQKLQFIYQSELGNA